jgi:hypothetical protein
LKSDGSAPPYICKKGHQESDPLIKYGILCSAQITVTIFHVPYAYICFVSHIVRYKVDVEVFDGIETAKFVFWDSSLEELLGMTAATLLEKQCQV